MKNYQELRASAEKKINAVNTTLNEGFSFKRKLKDNDSVMLNDNAVKTHSIVISAEIGTALDDIKTATGLNFSEYIEQAQAEKNPVLAFVVMDRTANAIKKTYKSLF